MRVNSIIAINAHQQPNQNTAQYTGTSPVKNASGMAFEDYLRANLQQLSNPTVTRQVEDQTVGLLMGYYTQMKITQKTEPEQESNVS